MDKSRKKMNHKNRWKIAPLQMDQAMAWSLLRFQPVFHQVTNEWSLWLFFWGGGRLNLIEQDGGRWSDRPQLDRWPAGRKCCGGFFFFSLFGFGQSIQMPLNRVLVNGWNSFVLLLSFSSDWARVGVWVISCARSIRSHHFPVLILIRCEPIVAGMEPPLMRALVLCAQTRCRWGILCVIEENAAERRPLSSVLNGRAVFAERTRIVATLFRIH